MTGALCRRALRRQHGPRDRAVPAAPAGAVALQPERRLSCNGKPPTATDLPLRLRNHDVRRRPLTARRVEAAPRGRSPAGRCLRSANADAHHHPGLGRRRRLSAVELQLPQLRRRARRHACAPRPRTQSSIFVRPDDGVDGVLFNASPDILEQIRANPALQPARALRDTAIAGVVLIDGQVDHATGPVHAARARQRRCRCGAPTRWPKT